MGFFKSCLNVVLKRDAVFAVMNAFCFGSVFVAVLWAQFQFPVACEGVPVEVLNPKNTWNNKNEFDIKAAELAKRFRDNFKEYESHVSDEVRNSGPRD